MQVADRSWSKMMLLTRKSLKVILRKRSVRSLFIISTLVVFGVLYLMWYLSRYQLLRFMTSDGYDKLQFDMECAPSSSQNRADLQCRPDGYNPDRASKGLSTSDVLFNKLSTGFLVSDTSEATQFVALLSSIMMNGLPLLGLDDFIHFSDFVGERMGKSAREMFLSAPGYKEKFSNFLDVRSNHLLLYPDNCWTQQFVSYLQAKTKLFPKIKHKIYKTKKQALKHRFKNVWAIVEIKAQHVDALSQGQNNALKCNIFSTINTKNTSTVHNNKQNTNQNQPFMSSAQSTVVPEITIRMHPAAVPDTRNYEISPINRHGGTRQQSGQLLYFTSGFLTLQMEMQNFLAHWQLGGSVIQSNVFTGHNEKILLRPAMAAHSLAQELVYAKTPDQVFQAILNATQEQAGVRPSLSFPLFHRAFPTHNYKQSLFWHTFGALTSIGLIIYFSLPAAITAGALSRERTQGQLEVLSTLPGVKHIHSLTAWGLCSAAWVVVCGVFGYAFFAAVLQHTSALLPALTLLLLGLVLGPVSSILGTVIRGADTIVVAVPTVVFITLLPGLLYFELAFDVQRSLWLELVLCLLPPSAAALLLRTVCGYEAINAGVLWTTPAAISRTPMYAYLIMLCVDLALYSAIAYSMALEQDIPLQYEGSAGKKATGGFWYKLGVSFTRCGAACVRCCTGLTSRNRQPLNAGPQQQMPGSHSYRELDQVEMAEVGTGLSSHKTSSARSGAFLARYGLDSLTGAALKVRSVSKQYTSGTSSVTVLSDVNANLQEQCITLLLGSNGAGKTTLMKVLSGLDDSYSGQVLFADAASSARANSMKQSKLNSAREIGWCPQNDALFDELTVEEHVILFARIIHASDGTPLYSSWLQGWIHYCFFGNVTLNSDAAVDTSNPGTRAGMNELVVQTLQQLDMLPHAHKRVSQLSGGMKRRLSLSLAFLGQPRVLFLDEPTSGCDSWTRELVRKDILSRRSSCAILISTHHTDDIEVLADRVWFLSERYLEIDEAVGNLAAWRSRELAQRAAPSTTNSSSASGRHHNAATTTKSAALPLLPHALQSNSGKSTDSIPDLGINGGHNLEFSTYDAVIKRKFVDRMGENNALSWLNSATTSASPMYLSQGVNHQVFSTTPHTEATVCNSWIVPVDFLHLLRQLVTELEAAGLHSWSLNTCSMYSTLCHLYDHEKHPSVALRAGSLHDAPAPVLIKRIRRRQHWFWENYDTYLRHVRAVYWMRSLELSSGMTTFLLAQVLLPFLVTLAVALGCRDVLYPMTEINSEEIGGVGEMLFAEGNKYHRHDQNLDDHFKEVPDPEVARINEEHELSGNEVVLKDSADAVETAPALPLTSTTEAIESTVLDVTGALMATEKPSPRANTTSPLESVLTKKFGSAQIKWAGALGSDQLWQRLFDTYYAHTEDRWAAFVTHDTIEQWVESTVLLSQPALNISIIELYLQVQRAKQQVCRITAPKTVVPVAPAEPAGSVETTEEGQVHSEHHSHGTHHGSNVHVRLHNKTLDQSTFCGDVPALRIEIRNDTFIANSTLSGLHDRQQGNLSIAITSFESLHSNLTMLSNVTTDHAAPTYLKEVIPVVYAAMLQQQAGSLDANSTAAMAAKYVLYSHPLPLPNRSNEVYMARGYLGSTIVVLYMLMTTIVAVRSVIKQRRTGVKTQLHLASMSPLSFWTGNLIFDALTVAVTLGAIYFAIVLGGAPISNYFFEFPPLPGVLFALCICAFSGAVVASSFALVVLSEDQLASQMLMLVSTVAGGLFLKLYLDRHAGEAAYEYVIRYFLHVSPAFTFSTAVFDLIAMHAMVVSASAQGKVGPDEAHLLRSVYHCVLIMCVQTVCYLGVTVTIDTYWVHIQAYFGRLRWYYSTTFNVPQLSASGKEKLDKAAPSSEFGRLLAEREPPILYGSLARPITEKIAPEEPRIMQLLHPDQRIGIFPRINGPEKDVLCTHKRTGLPAPIDWEHREEEPVHHTKWLVNARKLMVKYPQQDKLALCNTTFTIAPAERVALLGMNGGGKSTLFRTLALSENIPISGTLKVDGLDSLQDMWKLGPANELGYVPQEGGLLEFLTVQQTLHLFQVIRPPEGPGERRGAHVDNSAGAWDIIPAKFRNYPVSSLSGGTRKKLAVSVANTAHPRLLLLDECTTGVDPIAAERIVRYLKHSVDPVDQGVLFASHRIDESLAVCSRVIMLVDGHVYLDGDISALHDLAYQFYQVDVTLPQDEVFSPGLGVMEQPAMPEYTRSGAEVGLAVDLAGDLTDLEGQGTGATVERPPLHTRRPNSSVNDSSDANEHAPSRVQEFLARVAVSVSGRRHIERVVEYSRCLLRLTFEKRAVPISVMWAHLSGWVETGVIVNYAFRNMEMEEVLSTIIAVTREA